jgi:hypothetical protein
MASDLRYCRTHGEYRDYFRDGCPRCRQVEEESRDREIELAFRNANPGDYWCPHCKYCSLKNDATRCPLCHGEVSRDYWNEVRAAERVQAERSRLEQAARAAEEQRLAPIQAAQEAERRSREVNARVAAAGLWVVVGVYMFYVGPALVLSSWNRYPEYFPAQFKTLMGEVAWFPVVNCFYILLTPLWLLGVLIVGGLKGVGTLLLWLLWWAGVGVALAAVPIFVESKR